MAIFHGENKKNNFFEGWYFKHQKGDNTITFIPGVNIDEKGKKSAFIQVITNTKSYNINFPYSEFNVDKNTLKVKIGKNKFSEKGIKVDINTSELRIIGVIEYEKITPLRYGIMGPFSIFPFMECNHGIISLRHELKGRLKINNKIIDFNSGIGYIEKDWGSSFPKTYLWAQCNNFNNEEASIMVSIADIPFMGVNFKGCIAVVYYKGKEYRLATYNGVKILEYSNKGLKIKKGKYTLEVDINEISPQKLLAPCSGKMNRRICENAACNGYFRFYEKNKLVFDVQSNNTSFEYVE